MGLRAWLGLGRGPEDPRLPSLRAQEAGLRLAAQEAEEALEAMELDQRLLLAAACALRPGMGLQEAGETLLRLLGAPLGLATFYVAQVDWAQDRLTFPVFLEGGRLRRHPVEVYSASKGLTGLAMERNEPLYIKSLSPEGLALGARLSRAEEATGLIPQTWYGVPLALETVDGGRPFGLVAFQIDPEDGFPPRRREMLGRLARLVALAGAPR